MAKKNKLKIKPENFILVFTILLGIASTCMIFLNAFTLTITVEGALGDIIGAIGGNPTSTQTYTGLQSAFGYNEKIEGTNILTEHLSPNFLVIVGFLLPIIAIFSSIIFSDTKKLIYISAITYIISSICIFLAVLTMQNTILIYEKGSYELAMGTGVILSGIFSALAGFILLFKNKILEYI